MYNNPYNYMNSGINPYIGNQQMQPVQQPMQPAFTQQTQQGGLIRVTGVDGAKAYQMPPNSIAALFDNNDDLFYIKSTDGAGFPTIKAYKFIPAETETAPEQPMPVYVTYEEFEQFKKEMLNNGKQYIAKSADTNGKQNKSTGDKRH